VSLKQIEASGVVLVRGTLGGEPEILIVHRPRYDDWTIPKGKDDPGEIPEMAALRELYEETGYRAVLGERLDDQHYDVKGRPKVVRYFIGRPTGFDGLPSQDEVDDLEWVRLSKARKKLTYPRDRELVGDKRIKKAVKTGTVHLIRHAQAGSRSKWKGDDRVRPLSKRGRIQARLIADRISSMGVDLIHSSPFLRCTETVEPLSKLTGVSIHESSALAEGGDVTSTLDLIASAGGVRIALCSHGDVIPEVIKRLRSDGVKVDSGGRFRFSKGSIWEISVEKGAAVSARYIPPPDRSTS
jgi:8-oxo-(d)GTP phosphatase